MAMVELVATQMAAGGDAIARESSGRVVFVHGALPGERVTASITDERKDFARANVVDVLEAAPGRRQPPCPFVAEGCGGCGWQHIDPAAQRELKLAIVSEALRRTGRIADAVVHPGPALAASGFRTTLRLGVTPDGRVGFRAHHSHQLVAVDPCLVAHPVLADLVAGGRFPGATEVTLRGAVATGERLALVEPAEAAAHALVPEDVQVGPSARVNEVVAGRRFRISATSFFQTRHDGAEALVAEVAAAAGDVASAGVMVDAYAGVGLFAKTVGDEVEVVAVESSASACRDARRNLRTRAASVVRADVAEWTPVPAGLVVADPSRRGLGRRAADRLAATGAERLVLVSCDPVSLARDATLLAEHGFAHVSSTLVDLFPHTPHVEVVTRFDR